MLVANYVTVLDPTYLDDFLDQAGLPRHRRRRRSRRASNTSDRCRCDSRPPGAAQLSSVPTGDLTAAEVIITSGAAAGKTASPGRVASDGRSQVGLVFESVGDTIDITADPTVVDASRSATRSGSTTRGFSRADLPPSSFPPAIPTSTTPTSTTTSGTPARQYSEMWTSAARHLRSTGQIPTGRFNGR